MELARIPDLIGSGWRREAGKEGERGALSVSLSERRALSRVPERAGANQLAPAC